MKEERGSRRFTFEESERERETENFRGGSQLKAPPGSKELSG